MCTIYGFIEQRFIAVIAHWSRVLRPENIYVVENEHLSLSSKKSRPNVVLELMKIHRYLIIFTEANNQSIMYFNYRNLL